MKYLLHADGKLPNLALMRLSTHFRGQGQDVRLVRGNTPRTLFDPRGDVYGSSIFAFSAALRAEIERSWGAVQWGGTGVRVESTLSEIDATVDWDAVLPDYTHYPQFQASLGYLTRGCRLRCGFCVVPRSEGKPRAVRSVRELWRGEPYPRHLHLLDNDAFAPSLRDHWIEAVRELREGKFRVCFSQGINLRLVNEESAAALASLTYTDGSFSLRTRTLYTAWDNLGDETIFRCGVEVLRAAGIPSHRLTVYMLCGYDPKETWERIFYRHEELRALGCEPYPMVFDRTSQPDLCAFQRWSLRRLYRSVPWPEYQDGRLTPEARARTDAAWHRVRGGHKPVRSLPTLDEAVPSVVATSPQPTIPTLSRTRSYHRGPFG